MATFGKFLRQHYELLPKTYTEDLIYVRSTDIDRSIQSALVILSELFRPKSAFAYHRGLDWQPIPVHTVPLRSDHVIPMDLFNCSLFNRNLEMVLNQDRIVRNIFSSYADIINKFLGPIPAYDSHPESDLWKLTALLTIRENLIIDELQNM